jgi:hypothetical protein
MLNKNNSEFRNMIACRTKVSTDPDDASQCPQGRKGMQSPLILRWVLQGTSFEKGIRSINNSLPAMNTLSDSAVPTLQHQKQLTQHLCFPQLFRNSLSFETVKKRSFLQDAASPLLSTGKIRLHVSAEIFPCFSSVVNQMPG